MNHATWPTLSRNRAGAPATLSARAVPRGNRERRTAPVLMSAPRSEPDADRGQNHVDGEERDDAQDQRLVDRSSDALGAARDGEPAVAADQPRDQAEDRGLDDRDQHFRQA